MSYSNLNKALLQNCLGCFEKRAPLQIEASFFNSLLHRISQHSNLNLKDFKWAYLVPQYMDPFANMSTLWLFTVTECMLEMTELMKTVSGTQMISAGCFVPTISVSGVVRLCFNRVSIQVCRKNISNVNIYEKMHFHKTYFYLSYLVTFILEYIFTISIIIYELRYM